MTADPATNIELVVRDGVLQVHSPATRWLSSGYSGGYHDCAVAYNITVPDGWARTDLDEYVNHRLTAAGFDMSGPALLTGVQMEHARVATAGSVTAVATAGMSNPAELPVCPDGGTQAASAGTVNLLVHTTDPVSRSALPGLLGTVVEAKTATLLSATGFSGTTTDAVIVGSLRGDAAASFAGPATTLGAHTRVCVRDAVLAALEARDDPVPNAVEQADAGVVTDRSTTVFAPTDRQ